MVVLADIGALRDFACDSAVFAAGLGESAEGEAAPVAATVRLDTHIGAELIADGAVLGRAFRDRLGAAAAWSGGRGWRSLVPFGRGWSFELVLAKQVAALGFCDPIADGGSRRGIAACGVGPMGLEIPIQAARLGLSQKLRQRGHSLVMLISQVGPAGAALGSGAVLLSGAGRRTAWSTSRQSGR